MNNSEKSCSVIGCDNQGKLDKNKNRFFPRGFCNSHYKSFCKNNRDVIEESKKPILKCCVENCESPPPYKKEMCNKHYTRYSKYGDYNYVEKRKEGQTLHPLYNLYYGMKGRCYTETDKDYLRYGGRGIIICDRWLGTDGFFNFVVDMGERPKGFTLDRKDVDGNYEPKNCRWADIYTQSGNRQNSNDTGVSFCEVINKYRARISVGGVTHALGTFDNKTDALQARREGEMKYLGRYLNEKI